MNAITSSEMVRGLIAVSLVECWSSLRRPLHSVFFNQEVAEGEPFKTITGFECDDVPYRALSYLFGSKVAKRLRTILTTLVK